MKKTKTKQSQTYFYQDKPLFGLDIGHGSLRVMQLGAPKSTKGETKVLGYGLTTFPPEAIQDGTIVQPEVVAEAALELFKHNLVGTISSRRVALSLPTSHVFTRIVQLPKLSDKDVAAAVQLEAEQYVPVPLDDLYIDYTPINLDQPDTVELFMVAAPKKIVDSYLLLARMLGLEAVLFETSISASGRIFSYDQQNDIPAILIDFGSESADITVFDKQLVVSGTVPCGGEAITKLIADALNVTVHEANIIKSKYGLNFSKKQQHITTALEPTLATLIKEIRRTMRYYEERYGKEHAVGQIVMIGGGASMPGLSDYLTDNLRLPVRTLDPTSFFNFGSLQPLNLMAHTSYVTVAGLSMASPTEIFA